MTSIMKQKKSVFLVGDTGPFRIVALLLVLFLAGCGSANSPVPSPTPSIPFSHIDLGIPADALNSPVTGQVNDTTVMHVVLFFKINQSQQQQLQKIAGQGQD